MSAVGQRVPGPDDEERPPLTGSPVDMMERLCAGAGTGGDGGGGSSEPPGLSGLHASDSEHVAPAPSVGGVASDAAQHVDSEGDGDCQTEWGASACEGRRVSGRVRRAPQTYKFAGTEVEKDELDGAEYDSDEGAVDPVLLHAQARQEAMLKKKKRATAASEQAQPAAKRGPGAAPADDMHVTGMPPPASYLLPRYGAKYRDLVLRDGSALAPGVLPRNGRPSARFTPPTWSAVDVGAHDAPGGPGPLAPFASIDLVDLYSSLNKFFCSTLQASLGLATVHCSHSFLPWPMPPHEPGVTECKARTCVALRQSGHLVGQNPSSVCATTGVRHVTSMELYLLMLSYSMDMGRREVRSLSTVLSRGGDIIDLGDTRDRVSGVFKSILGTSCDVTRVRVSLAPAMKPNYTGRELFVTLVLLDPMAALLEFMVDVRWCAAFFLHLPRGQGGPPPL
jgi:hypothetical protein